MLNHVQLPAGQCRTLTEREIDSAELRVVAPAIVMCEAKGEGRLHHPALGALVIRRLQPGGKPQRYAALWQVEADGPGSGRTAIATVGVATRSRKGDAPWRAVLDTAGPDPHRRTRPDAVPPAPWVAAAFHPTGRAQVPTSALDAIACAIAWTWITRIAEDPAIATAA